ncbi:MAG: hypothetical protein M1816_002968 [Peltula sp. TS41687]|nr:MAG: hypothetical protein M1816_002968 [Peltula sp. TS41687]
MKSSRHLPIFLFTTTAALLLPRQDQATCPDSTFSACTNAGKSLPSNFCCPQSTKCIAINSNKAIICCPDGQDCQYIKPIICDIEQQNADTFPKNPIHTTELSAKLDTCGDGCCPGGYLCVDGQCKMVLDDKQKAGVSGSSSSSSSSSASKTASSSSSSTTSKPTSAGSTTTTKPTTTTSSSSSSSSKPATTTTTSTASTTPTTSPSSTPSPSSFSGKSFVAGLIPGLVLGVLLTLAFLFCLGRKTKKISRPILRTSNTDPTSPPSRTDFLRRYTSTTAAPGSNNNNNNHQTQRQSETASMEFILADDPLPAPPQPPVMSGAGAGGGQQLPGGRYQGGVTAGGGGAGGNAKAVPTYGQGQDSRMTRMTNFTDLMENAGFKRGEPFLPSQSSSNYGSSPGRGGRR